VDAHGVVRCETLPALLEGGAALVSVMAANNETGVIQPVAEVLRLASAAGVPVHVDATQAAGRIPVDFAGLGARFLTASAHKLHGPKGVGVLVVKKGAP
jgi:cysteine desulfurase